MGAPGRVRRLTGKPNGEFSSAAAGAWFLTLVFLLVGVLLTSRHVQACGGADSSSQAEAVAVTDDDETSDFVSAYKGPCDVAASPDGERLYVVEKDSRALTVVNVAEGKVVRTIPLPDEPTGVCVSPDGKSADVTCGVANGLLRVVDLPSGKVTAKLPASHSPRGLSLSPKGERAYVNTVLLDDIDLGAANPYDVATSADGSVLFVSHAGTHEVSAINATDMLEKLPALPSRQSAPDSELSQSAELSVEDVPNTLAFLKGMRQRVKLEGVGPRGLAVVGNRAYCAMYFSDTLGCVVMKSQAAPLSEIALGPKPVMTEGRKGKMYFQDARLCFQQWLACATCHPGGRTDGLNWDLIGDGLGNPKSTKSLLLAHETPPMMISGEPADAETAVLAMMSGPTGLKCARTAIVRLHREVESKSTRR